MIKQLLILLLSVLSVTAWGQSPYQLVFGIGPLLHFDDSSTTKHFYIDTTLTNNIWQIGTPQKTFMDSAYTIPNALITDTVSFYPTDNYSTVNMTFLVAEGLMWFNFRHKFDTDTLKDGGKIELSIDAGTTWHNVLDTGYWSANGYSTSSDINFYSYNDTVTSLGDQGFSGRSNGWINSEFTFFWQNATMYPDTFHLRFVFASDSTNTNKEGWLIDEIYIGATHVGIEEYQLTSGSIYPNPTSGLIKFKEIKEPVLQIRIYNSIGQIIETLDQPDLDRVDLRHLDNGLYFVSISTDKYLKSSKIILKKE